MGIGLGMAAAAAASSAGNIGVGVASGRGAKRIAKKNRAFAKAENKRNRRFQERMSSTAHQRAADDLQSAGLNRILAVTQGGASTPSGGVATSQADEDRVGKAARGAMQGIQNDMSTALQYSMNKAQKGLITKQGLGVEASTKGTEASTAKTVADTKAVVADTVLKELKAEALRTGAGGASTAWEALNDPKVRAAHWDNTVGNAIVVGKKGWGQARGAIGKWAKENKWLTKKAKQRKEEHIRVMKNITSRKEWVKK